MKLNELSITDIVKAVTKNEKILEREKDCFRLHFKMWHFYTELIYIYICPLTNTS